MAKKAKSTIVCEGKVYEQGKVFSNDDVKHLDQNDFLDVADEITPEAPKTGTAGAEDEKKVDEASSTASGESSQNGSDANASGASEALV